MYRYFVLICAVVMQACLGATYSWSVYVNRLKLLADIGQGTAQLPFTVFYFTFPATMIIVGNMLHRIGTRRAAVIGGIIFGGGWMIAGWGSLHFAFTILGIGLLAGIGVGFAYMVPITTSILWFPRHKGLVTGIAVAGFGGGAALVSLLGGYLMNTALFTPFETFSTLGLVFLLTVSIAGIFMKVPPGFSFQSTRPLSSSQILRDKTFLLLYSCMFIGLAAGFTVNANLKELSGIITIETGVLGVSLFAIANAAGRVSWGLLFDRIASTTAIRLNLLCQAILLFAGYWLLRHSYGFLAFATFAGFNYGGVLVVYASTVARKWGAEKVGQVYGWLFSANIPAALAPLLAGIAYDVTGRFVAPLILLSGTLLFAGTALCRGVKDH